MRKLLLTATAAFFAANLQAQTVSTFEALTLNGTDSAYVNFTASGQDVGFNDGLAHFPCVYDTSFGGYWSRGFAYSRKTDSVTSGFANQYAAKAGRGYGGSTKYAVSYGSGNIVRLLATASGKGLSGVYITNSTYAYNSMRSGDQFAKKFGGTTGNDSDFYKVIIRGYLNGSLKSDSVEFFLADFRGPGSSDYIIRNWTYVALNSLGNVDSVRFDLRSSDNGAFGMNTPAYFCIDNFTTNETGLSVDNRSFTAFAKVFPNPATSEFHIQAEGVKLERVTVMDISGKQVFAAAASNDMIVSTQSWPSGLYVVLLEGEGRTASVRLVKQ